MHCVLRINSVCMCVRFMTQSYDLYATGRKAIVNLRKAKSAQILDALCYINHIFVLVFCKHVSHGVNLYHYR